MNSATEIYKALPEAEWPYAAGAQVKALCRVKLALGYTLREGAELTVMHCMIYRGRVSFSCRQYPNGVFPAEYLRLSDYGNESINCRPGIHRHGSRLTGHDRGQVYHSGRILLIAQYGPLQPLQNLPPPPGFEREPVSAHLCRPGDTARFGCVSPPHSRHEPEPAGIHEHRPGRCPAGCSTHHI